MRAASGFSLVFYNYYYYYTCKLNYNKCMMVGWLHLQKCFLKWQLSVLCLFLNIMCTIYWTRLTVYVTCPIRTTNTFYLIQVWLVSVLSFQKHAQAHWLDGWFVLLASERAGPISKWAELHVIPSKRKAHDLIWKTEAQRARDIFR